MKCRLITFLGALFLAFVTYGQTSDSIKAKADSGKQYTSQGVPVVLNEDTIFRVRANYGSFTAKERAEKINERLLELSEHDVNVLDSIKVVEDENRHFHIVSGDIMIMTITDEDAKLENKQAHDLAHLYLEKVQKGLKKEIYKNDIFEIIKEIALTILLVIILILIFRVTNRFVRKVNAKIEKLEGTKLTGWKIKDVEVLTQEREVQIIVLGIKVLRITFLSFIIYFAITALAGIFPWTRDLADSLIDFVVSPIKSLFSAILDYIPNLFFIAIIVFFTRFVVRGIRFFSDEIEKGNIEFNGFRPEWATPTYNIVRFVVYAFSVIVIFPYLPGSKSDAFKGVSIFLGVLFSLGSSSAISNLVAGLVITYMVPFRVGDRIKIGNNVGDVIDRTMLVTKLRTIKNEEITIPNALVLSSHVTNYNSGTEPLILYTTVTIGYDVPWDKVHELLIKAGLNTQNILKEPKPFVLQTALGSYSVKYELNSYTDKPNIFEFTYSDLRKNIQDSFNDAGIEILTPIYSAVRDGNHTTVATDKVPQDYKAPSFAVSIIDKLTGKK